MKDSYGESLCMAFLFYSYLWTFLSLISINNFKDLMTKISSTDETKLALHCIYWYVITIFMLDTIIFVNPIKHFDVSIYCTMYLHIHMPLEISRFDIFNEKIYISFR